MEKNEKLTRYSQELRKNATKEENTLWYQYLRRYPVRFRRQCVFGPYIVDFYCAKAKLIIELDGSQHYEPLGIQKDIQRTQYLESLGIQVLRFCNTDIHQNLRGVCEQIDTVIQQRLGAVLDGPGRAAYTSLQTLGRTAPHPPPFGGTFPPRGRFFYRRIYVNLRIFRPLSVWIGGHCR